MSRNLAAAGSKLLAPFGAAMSSKTNRLSTEHGQPRERSCAFEAREARRTCRAAPPMFIAFAALGGCAGRGAPSFVLVGAFFPAWMLCALIGIFGAVAARGFFVASGLDSVLPFQLFVSASIGLVIGTLTWFIWFGQ
jgi:YtcA family